MSNPFQAVLFSTPIEGEFVIADSPKFGYDLLGIVYVPTTISGASFRAADGTYGNLPSTVEYHPQLLMSKSKDKVVEELRAKHENDQFELKKAVGLLRKEESAADELKKSNDELEERAKAVTKRYSDAIERINICGKRCEQMERDLSKLRNAIGEIKFNEIVGAQASIERK